MDHPTPESVIPFDVAEEAVFEGSYDLRLLYGNVKTAIRNALLLKVLRPDRALIALEKLVQLICGKDFLTVPDDLYHIVTKEVKSTVPVILVSSPGIDLSLRVLDMADKQSKYIESIAMGSEEGYDAADKAIGVAARRGLWVLLKNVHLASKWLQDLEKKLDKMHLHNDFRIFLSMEFSQKVSKTF